MNILITEALTANAAKLRKKLEDEGHTVFLASAELPEFMLNSSGYLRIPQVADASFAHKMLTVCLDGGINKIYSNNIAEFNLLKEAEILFAEYGIEIAIEK